MTKDLFKSLLIPAFCLLTTGCADKPHNAAAKQIESLISDIKIFETDANQRTWHLNSKKALLDEKKGTMSFVNPNLKFYKDDKIASNINSDKGVLDLNTRDTTLTNNVTVNSKNENSVLKTKKLLFSAAKNKIWTKEKVTIYRQNTVITGSGLTANPDLSEIEIQDQETQLKTK